MLFSEYRLQVSGVWVNDRGVVKGCVPLACQSDALYGIVQEGSQETAATLVGMMLGMIVARVTAGHALGVWTSFLLLTVFHMYGE